MDAVARDLLSNNQEWRVHSVFERALNLRSAGGELLGLALAPAPDAPATVVVEKGPIQASLSETISPGMIGFVDNGLLSIGERLTVDLRNAVRWSARPIKRTADAQTLTKRIGLAQEIGARYAPTGGLAPLLARIDDLASPAPTTVPQLTQSDSGETASSASMLGALGRERRESGTGDALVERADEAVRLVVQGWRASDLESFASGARMLSGLGPGLTPSGDDLLAGLALGLWAALGSLPDQIGVAIEAAIVGRTTDLAVARVEHAVAGRADAYVDAVLRALVTVEGANFASSVATLLGYGHTSGVDTLVGLLLGVKLALK